MIKSRTAAITTTRSRIDQTGVDEGSSGQSIAILNEGVATVYLGGAAVTADADDETGGFTLASGASLTLDLQVEEQLHAVTASGTATLRVLETGV